MRLRLSDRYFARSPSGALKRVPEDVVSSGARKAVEGRLVALRIDDAGKVDVEDLPFRSVREALASATPGTRIGIPVTDREGIGVVFRIAVIAGPERNGHN